MRSKFNIITDINRNNDTGFRAMQNSNSEVFDKCLKRNSELQQELREFEGESDIEIFESTVKKLSEAMSNHGMPGNKPVSIKIKGYPGELLEVNEELVCIEKEEFPHEIILTLTPKSIWIAKNTVYNQD